VAKIRKSFKQYEDLSYVKAAVDELIDVYGEKAVLSDILNNVTENEAKWEECSLCNGNGWVTNTVRRTFVTCPVCKGTKHTRIKRKKEAKE
jgi:DnaJ-class molecular chaperone